MMTTEWPRVEWSRNADSVCNVERQPTTRDDADGELTPRHQERLLTPAQRAHIRAVARESANSAQRIDAATRKRIDEEKRLRAIKVVWRVKDPLARIVAVVNRYGRTRAKHLVHMADVTLAELEDAARQGLILATSMVDKAGPLGRERVTQSLAYDMPARQNKA